MMLTEEQFGFNAFWWELKTEDAMKACVDCLANIGYKRVEFKRLSFRQDALAEEFKTGVRIAREAGLTVSNFVVLRNLASGELQAIEDVIETVQACSEAKVGLLNTVSGSPADAEAPSDWWMPPQASAGKAWDHLVSAFEQICQVAEQCGVYIVLEPCIGALVHDYYSLQELFRRIDHPHLCVTMDPSHLFLYRNDIPYAIARLGERIKHVHLKDAAGHPGVLGLDFMFPALGSGGIDWAAFFNALNAVNYQGALSVEYEQFKYMAHVLNGDPAPAAKTSYTELTALYNFYTSGLS